MNEDLKPSLAHYKKRDWDMALIVAELVAFRHRSLFAKEDVRWAVADEIARQIREIAQAWEGETDGRNSQDQGEAGRDPRG